MSCLVLAGCHARPLPQDFGGLETSKIVTQIRCETYYALRDQLADQIAKLENKRVKEGSALPPRPGTAERFRNGDLRFANMTARDVGPDLLRQIDRYRRTTVGYSFLFDMTEANNLSGAAGFEKPYFRGPFLIGVSAQSDRSRQNVRTFRLVDIWDDLLRDDITKNTVGLQTKYTNAKICDPYEKIQENLNQPITGKIGMKSQIATFYNLNETSNLVGLENEVPTVTDTLTFASLVRGSVTPSVTIGPLSDAFRLASISGTAEARRQDSHKVTIVIALPEETKSVEAAKSAVTDELIRQEDNEFYSVSRRDLTRLSN